MLPWKYHPQRYYRFAQRQWKRARKALRQRRRFDQSASKTPVLVVGAQRSGTNMLVSVLDRAPDVWLYNEFHRAAFDNYRLRTLPSIQRLIDKCYAPFVAFKPLCDSHRTDEVLDRFPSARAIWIYRRYQDTSNSAVRRFENHRRDWVGWIANDDYARLGWRGERLEDDLVQLMKQQYRANMLLEDAAALTWYQRTQLYYQLGLDAHDRVLLVQYETLVRSPADEFRRIFDFVGCPFSEQYVDRVRTSSIEKDNFPKINSDIRALCDKFQTRIDGDFQYRRNVSSGN